MRELGSSAARRKTAICVGGPTSRVVRRRPAGTAPCSRSAAAVVVGPGRELRAGPLEPVVAVAHRARRQELVADVVLGVRRGDDDRRRAGRAPNTVRSSAGSRGRVDVLDDLHQHDRVVARPAGRRGRSAEDCSSSSRARWRVRHPVQPQPPRGDLQRPVRHVDAEDAGERGVGAAARAAARPRRSRDRRRCGALGRAAPQHRDAAQLRPAGVGRASPVVRSTALSSAPAHCRRPRPAGRPRRRPAAAGGRR